MAIYRRLFEAQKIFTDPWVKSLGTGFHGQLPRFGRIGVSQKFPRSSPVNTISWARYHDLEARYSPPSRRKSRAYKWPRRTVGVARLTRLPVTEKTTGSNPVRSAMVTCNGSKRLCSQGFCDWKNDGAKTNPTGVRQALFVKKSHAYAAFYVYGNRRHMRRISRRPDYKITEICYLVPKGLVISVRMRCLCIIPPIHEKNCCPYAYWRGYR